MPEKQKIISFELVSPGLEHKNQLTQTANIYNLENNYLNKKTQHTRTYVKSYISSAKKNVQNPKIIDKKIAMAQSWD